MVLEIAKFTIPNISQLSKKSKKLLEAELAHAVLVKFDSIWPGSSMKMENHVLDGIKALVRKFFKSIDRKDRVLLDSKLLGLDSESLKGSKNVVKRPLKSGGIKKAKSVPKKPTALAKRKK